jgi:hypothetical protein
MSILKDLIPEAISGQKCHMNIGPVLSGYGVRVLEIISLFTGKIRSVK